MINISPMTAELAACIDACLDCLQACTACADACLGEHDLFELRRCIALNLSCADVCDATGRMITRQHGSSALLLAEMLAACRQACLDCAEECERHTHHEHCRVCAEVCRRCAAACDGLLASLQPA